MKQLLLFAACFFLMFRVLAGTSIPDSGNDGEPAIGSETAFQPGLQGNPFQLMVRENRLQILLDESHHTGKIFLFDLLGNKIHESTANDNIDWSLAGLKSGVYFVVWKDNKASITKKLVYKQEG